MRILRSAKIAKLHEFIMLEKYQTTIGERGIRLSGQRQRIGIARALYRPRY